jgi:DNA-directed RNA polymerase sigma subunit (sigma70/sigma32)
MVTSLTPVGLENQPGTTEPTYEQISQVICSLTNRQRIIFSLLYGLNTNGVTLTVTEIASLLKVSYKRVQDVKRKVIEKVGSRNIRKLISASASASGQPVSLGNQT